MYKLRKVQTMSDVFQQLNTACEKCLKALVVIRQVCPEMRRTLSFDKRVLLGMAASLMGCLGQARFPSFFWVFVTHPGHASLRSLVDAVMAPLHAYVGSDVESPAFRRAFGGAAVIFGFFYYQTGHVYMPERARTSSGEGRPR
jgi:hypothetical protein